MSLSLLAVALEAEEAAKVAEATRAKQRRVVCLAHGPSLILNALAPPPATQVASTLKRPASSGPAPSRPPSPPAKRPNAQKEHGAATRDKFNDASQRVQLPIPLATPSATSSGFTGRPAPKTPAPGLAARPLPKLTQAQAKAVKGMRTRHPELESKNYQFIPRDDTPGAITVLTDSEGWQFALRQECPNWTNKGGKVAKLEKLIKDFTAGNKNEGTSGHRGEFYGTKAGIFRENGTQVRLLPAHACRSLTRACRTPCTIPITRTARQSGTSCCSTRS